MTFCRNALAYEQTHNYLESFVYLGSVQPSEGQCLPDIKTTR